MEMPIETCSEHVALIHLGLSMNYVEAFLIGKKLQICRQNFTMQTQQNIITLRHNFTMQINRILQKKISKGI